MAKSGDSELDEAGSIDDEPSAWISDSSFNGVVSDCERFDGQYPVLPEGGMSVAASTPSLAGHAISGPGTNSDAVSVVWVDADRRSGVTAALPRRVLMSAVHREFSVGSIFAVMRAVSTR